MSDILEVRHFKDGIDDFMSLLGANKIPYEEIDYRKPGVVYASGEMLEVVKALAGLSLAPSIAAVIVQWQKSKASREVILQTKENQVVHLKGYSVEEVQNLIPAAENITAIQTETD